MNARSSEGTVVIVIECKDSVIIVNGYLVFINTVSIIVCVYLCFKIHTYFSLRGNHAFERRPRSVNTCKTRVNARSSEGTVVIAGYRV